MLAEDDVVVHPDNIVLIVLVLLLQIPQEAQFDTSLMLEAFLVADDLDGDHGLLLVIEAFESLAKAPGAQLVEHFKPVCQMILQDDLVVASLVIKAEIVAEERLCGYLFGVQAQEVDFWVILDLKLLIV